VVDIEQLHDRLFGYVPAKKGTAYERIGAVVLALFGSEDVIHDLDEQPAGRQATHQLDITARDPRGHVKRLLVECKDWNETVGQGTVNMLVGVRNQIGADAAVVLSTEGFTNGALNVAINEDIALVRLAAYDPTKHGTDFAKRIVISAKPLAPPERSDFDVEVADPHGRTEVTIQLTGDDHLLLADGSPAERIQGIVERHISPAQEGQFRRRAELPPGRFIPTVDGEPVELRVLSWTETSRSAGTFEIVHEAKGEPVLFMEQINDEGEGESGRLLVSEDLFARGIDNDGNVLARGTLGA
jgi:restriction endonuclease